MMLLSAQHLHPGRAVLCYGGAELTTVTFKVFASFLPKAMIFLLLP